MKRKLAFLFTHLPQLVRFYRNAALSGVFAVFARVFASAIKDAGWQTHSFWSQTYLLLQYGPLVVFLLLLGLASMDLFLRRLAGAGIVQDRLLLDAYYYTNGNYTLLKRVHCINDSRDPTRSLLEVKEGYHEEPAAVRATCRPLTRDASHVVTLSDSPIVEMQKHSVAGVATEVYKYQWHATFDPPLEARERFSFYVRVSAQGVEKKAFTPEGTLFSWLVETRTHEMQICVHPPCGYVVRLLEYSVADETDQVAREEARAVPRPRMLGDGSMIQWRLLLPRPQLRYGLRYRIEKLGD